ncbi:Translation initiation factor IF-2, mitochondrial [Smittium culicis]|uniref:Translation initiation factor IF-2, mitochondrial n=1 Tax=Smittium culicis TaxID=133412 RepID=A0A1R1Y3T9_9FUNG|nr:Translation initiation factor IF-2, mitochondrial [Smittium culicis]
MFSALGSKAVSYPTSTLLNSTINQSCNSINNQVRRSSSMPVTAEASELSNNYDSVVDIKTQSFRDESISFESEADLNEKNLKKKSIKRRLSLLSKNSPVPGKKISIPLTISVDSLAKLIGIKQDIIANCLSLLGNLINRLRNLGIDKLAPNLLLSNEEAKQVAKSFRLVPISNQGKAEDIFPRQISEKIESYPVRPPVVTIMGHVDHGKTTLLDSLRNSKIVSTEFVKVDDGSVITFLDTPGHSAFSAMRQRGANVTDIAVIVVAADDGVMPQTKEAIRHALDAEVPIIIAITKCDKHNSDPEKIKTQLLECEIHVEDLGGDIQVVEISAAKRTGLDLLTENIAALAELLELHAENDIPVEATIIESKIAKGRGNEASLVVLRGCLRPGDIIVAGSTWSKVRSISDESGKMLKEVMPGFPALVSGWKELPTGGDLVLGVNNESEAKRVVSYRIKTSKEVEVASEIEAFNISRIEVNDKKSADKLVKKRVVRKGGKIFKQVIGSTDLTYEKRSEEPEIKTLPIILKGTLEAILEAISNLPSSKVVANVIDSGVGPVSESEVQLASNTKNAIIVTFNLKSDKQIESTAKKSKVEIVKTNVIYKLIEKIRDCMKNVLDPIYEDVVEGEARVQQVFPITVEKNIIQNIAGSRVVTGAIEKHSLVKVVRDGEVIADSSVNTLKQVKKDIAKVTKGMDCGIGILEFDDIRNEDIIQSYKKVAVEQTID